MAYFMVPLTETEFKSRFARAFSIKPEMTIDEFHKILKANDWNEKISLRQVLKFVSTATPDSDCLDEEDSDDFSELFEPVESGAVLGLGSEALMAQKESRSTKRTSKVSAVTKWIGRLADGLFVRAFLACEGEHALQNIDNLEVSVSVKDMSIRALLDLTVDPETVFQTCRTEREEILHSSLVGPPIWKDEITGKIGYAAAIINGVNFHPGEFVTVRRGIDGHRLAQTPLKSDGPGLVASIWYARIAYIFEGDEGPCAHMHWLSHGGDTVLGETAGPRELFVIHHCDDAPLGSVTGKVMVDFVGKNDTKGQDGLGVVELDYHDVKRYFYRLAYSEADDRFEEAQDLSVGSIAGKQHCSCCVMASKRKIYTQIRSWTEDGRVESIVHLGVKYGLQDFVYLTPNELAEPYTVAQIMEIKSSGLRQWMSLPVSQSIPDLKVTVQTYHRYDDLLETYFDESKHEAPHVIRDSRRLYRDTFRLLTVSLGRLDGKCIVQHINFIHNLNEFKDLEDSFFVADQIMTPAKIGVPRGRKCLADLVHLMPHELCASHDNEEDLAIELNRFKDFKFRGHKLKAMDIFSGAGGLTVGLDQSEAVFTAWAIESDTPAAETLKRNFPLTEVYNQDASILLRQAIEEHEGTTNGPLTDLDQNPLPRMPCPGEVDFIYGGPPFQRLSNCKRYEEANSIKNSLLATFLSYVDHYRPKYFLLENIPDLLSHRIGSSQSGTHKIPGGIEMGFAKFILRSLTSLGYQAQFSVLQAAEHGTPQSRARVFFWGAAPGSTLPKFPEPTHIFPAGRAPKPTRRSRRSAPHRTVTIGDAITDLPAFDWSMYIRGEHKDDRNTRFKRQIPQVQAGGNSLGIGPVIQGYHPGCPLSEYQRQSRQNVQQDGVYNHYTCRWVDSTMQRIMKIPMQPGAKHLDLCSTGDAKYLLPENPAAPRHTYFLDRYRRLDYEKLFQTCLTKIDPSGKNGSILHPSQHRVLTVREQARALGFPDTFTWDQYTQTPSEMCKQIDKSVAIPVGRALGRELFKVLAQIWETGHTFNGPKDVRPDDVLESIETDYESGGDLLGAGIKRESDLDSECSSTSKRARRIAVTSDDEDTDVQMGYN